MYPFDKDNILRRVSIKLLRKPLLMTGLSANKITVLGFLLLNIPSIVLFIFGHELLGLVLATLGAMVDYLDGTIARERKEVSKVGGYLDTSLDWLYLMLIIGSLVYAHQMMVIGYATLIAITFGNWVRYNGDVDYCLPKIIGITPLLVIGILTRTTELALWLIFITQTYRTGRMYLWSILKGLRSLD